MDINIIISGNLTGFSRFYATPNASDLYADGKFDFDYRNFLTFLNNGEKAYAISFAPHIVSVSLITRILDSFRRPGILVVSVLLQRGMIVDSIMNPHNKNALYQLLNELNDKFYERNFMNGMINQNAAVLMQDYYSDILSNYRLTSDNNQRRVNGNIDINIPNKRSGYIASSEIDIPLYLSSLYRRGYEGFHHIFFAPNAPQNIDETPEEVVMYRVYITNNKLTLTTLVKLTDQIYRLSPNQGEIAFDQNYTYGDVLQGKAGSQIRASIVGETLEVSYRFKEEEKTINFIFEDRGKIISLAQIAPVIQDTDGTRYNLSSDTFKFIGKEIYGKKVLKSTNPNYVIKAESATLDLQRLNDGATCHIQVESSSVLEESKEYQTASEHLGNQQSLTLTPKPVTNHPVRTVRPENSSMPPTISTKNVSQKGTLKLSDGSGNKKEQIKGNKLNIKKILLVAIPLFIILLFAISWHLNIGPWNNDDDINKEDVSIEEVKSLIKKCVVKLKDYADDYLKQDDKFKEMQSLIPIEEIVVEVDDGIEERFSGNQDTARYEFIALENCSGNIRFKVLYDTITVCDSVIQFDKVQNDQVIDLKLNIRTSAIILCKNLLDIKEKVPTKEWKNIEKAYNKSIEEGRNDNQTFIGYLTDLYKRVESKYASNGSANVGATSVTEGEPKEVEDEIPDSFNRLDLTLETLKQLKAKKEKEAEVKRKGALEAALMRIEKGKLPDNKYLSNKYQNTSHGHQLSQKLIVDDLISIWNDLSDDKKEQFAKDLKEKKSLFQAYDLVKKYNEGKYTENAKRQNIKKK